MVTNFTSELKRQVFDETDKSAREKFNRKKFVTKSLKDLFYTDLVDVIPYAKINRGYKDILIVISCFSKNI